MNITRAEFDAVFDGIVKAFLTLPEEKRTQHNIERIMESLRYVLPGVVSMAHFDLVVKP